GAARAAVGALLQLIGEPPDDQITTEAQRRSGVIKCSPDTPQILCRLTDQPDDFAIKFCQRRTSPPVLPAVVGKGDRRTARQSAGEPKRRELGVSQDRRLGNAVDPAALLFGRGKSEPELFLES